MERDGQIIPDAPTGTADGGGLVTRLIDRAGRGDAAAARDLLPLVYDCLRDVAGRRMAGERAGHTLQATALVHEAYLRLVGGAAGERKPQWASRAQFFHAAAEAMRRILVEHARARGRLKRGGGAGGDGGAVRATAWGDLSGVADLAAAADADPDAILAVDDAVRRLEAANPDVGAVVRLRFYAGLSPDETAAALGTSPRTVYRQWAYARAWLFRELERHADDAGRPARVPPERSAGESGAGVTTP